MAINLSVIILTKNEEKNIRECIGSVSFADEIIVIDDNSEDKTRDIAKKLGALVYKRSLDDFASQRNFGLSKATGDWILFVDADERVSPELQQEILSAIATKQNSLYKIPRKNKLFGKYLEHTDWYPDYQHRLFKNGEGQWTRKVHEQLGITGTSQELSKSLLHNNYDTIDDFVKKNYGIYADYEAELLISSGYQFSWQDLLAKPSNEFMRRFFASGGYKDGVHGLVASLLVSIATFIIYTKVWEKQGFTSQSLSLFSFKNAYSSICTEMDHWIRASIVSNEKNPALKLVRKIME